MEKLGMVITAAIVGVSALAIAAVFGTIAYLVVSILLAILGF